MHSYTEENYLKEIFKLSETKDKAIATNAIAAKLDTSAASVTDMLKKLASKKLIHYTKYQGVYLSNKGRKVAIEIIRKHRLWEVFLVEKLKFKWDEVHEMAEQLEHINSKEMVDRLDKYLGYPSIDPHGDPIPDSNGKISATKSQLLSELGLKETATILGVKEHSSSFLQHIEKLGIEIGKKVFMKEKSDYDRSICIQLNKKFNIHLSYDVSKNIIITLP